MKVGDLVQIDVDPHTSYDLPVAPHQRGIIIEVNSCEWMPSYRVYRFINKSVVWMYDVNIRLINPS